MNSLAFLPTTINCKGHLLDISSPKVMGILNVTPDSFFDGGKHKTQYQALTQVEKMLNEGASIIDIGGMSTKPGAETITVEEELRRVITIIETIHHQFPEAIISIDTIHSKVAKEAVQSGASIVNDVSAGSMDSALFQTVAELDVPYILMHMKGTPKNMQRNPTYDDIILEMTDFFIDKVGQLRKLGIKDIVLDVGFGFGKTIEDNYTLLNRLRDFEVLNLPSLVGLSRKSMIYKYLGSTPQEALNGTSALHMVALQNGAKILRVHDVKEAVEVIRLYEQLERCR